MSEVEGNANMGNAGCATISISTTEDTGSSDVGKKMRNADRLERKIRARWAEVIIPTCAPDPNVLTNMEIPKCVGDIQPIRDTLGMNMAHAVKVLSEVCEDTIEHQLAVSVITTYYNAKKERVEANTRTTNPFKNRDTPISNDEAYRIARYTEASLNSRMVGRKICGYLLKDGTITKDVYDKIKTNGFKIYRSDGKLLATIAGVAYFLCNVEGNECKPAGQEEALSLASPLYITYVMALYVFCLIVLRNDYWIRRSLFIIVSSLAQMSLAVVFLTPESGFYRVFQILEWATLFMAIIQPEILEVAKFLAFLGRNRNATIKRPPDNQAETGADDDDGDDDNTENKTKLSDKTKPE